MKITGAERGTTPAASYVSRYYSRSATLSGAEAEGPRIDEAPVC